MEILHFTEFIFYIKAKGLVFFSFKMYCLSFLTIYDHNKIKDHFAGEKKTVLDNVFLAEMNRNQKYISNCIS